MKRNEIIGEHKKGFKAKKYAQKPKTYIEPTKPQKPQAPVSEEAKITKSDASGVEITAADGVKTTLPPEKAAALTPDPSNPNEYDLNPAATSPTGDTPAGPKVGANVEIKTAEAVVDDEFDAVTLDSATGFKDALRKAAANSDVDDSTMAAIDKMVVTDTDGSVDVNATMKNSMVMLGDAIPQFVQFYRDLLDAMINATRSPEFAQVGPEEKQSIADMINDMKMQIPVLERQAKATLSQMQAMQQTAQQQESDDALLEKMRMIAGLR